MLLASLSTFFVIQCLTPKFTSLLTTTIALPLSACLLHSSTKYSNVLETFPSAQKLELSFISRLPAFSQLVIFLIHSPPLLPSLADFFVFLLPFPASLWMSSAPPPFLKPLSSIHRFLLNSLLLLNSRNNLNLLLLQTLQPLIQLSHIFSVSQRLAIFVFYV